MYTKEQLVEMLKKGVVEITFTKVNGEQRVMLSTLCENLLPTKAFTAESAEAKRDPNPDVIAVYVTDAQGWRSFRVANVISAKEVA